MLSATSDLQMLSDRLARMAVAAGPLLTAGMALLVEDAEALVVPSIEEHTPVDTGGLRDSTVPEPFELGVDTMGLAVRQTKRVGAKQWVLASLLIDGHRIVTRGGHDTGRSTEPMPYVEDALLETMPAFELMLTAGARHLAENLCAVLQ